MWSEIAGGLASGLGNAAGSALGAYATAGINRSQLRYAARLNYKYGQKSLLNSPSNYVQGLRAAGLNPILAATGGQIGSTSSAGASPVGVDFSSSVDRGIQSALELRKARADVRSAENEADLLESEAASAKARATLDSDPEMLRRRLLAGQAESLSDYTNSAIDAYSKSELLNSLSSEYNNPQSIFTSNDEVKPYGNGISLKVLGNYIKGLEREGYINSKGHAIGEDILKVGDTAGDLISKGMSARAKRLYRQSRGR